MVGVIFGFILLLVLIVGIFYLTKLLLASEPEDEE